MKIIIFICIISVILTVINAFQNNRYIHIQNIQTLNHNKIKTRPLSTVNADFSTGYIPRLEIGLRHLRSNLLTVPIGFHEIKFINPLEWLQPNYSKTNNKYSMSALLNLSGKLFGYITNKITSFSFNYSLKLMKHMKNIMTTTLILASSFTSPNFSKLRMIAGASIASLVALPKHANAGNLSDTD